MTRTGVLGAAPRIALIHALAHSIAPVNEGFAREWPEAVRMNLLDDSLSADLARSATGLDARMQARFDALADYALGTGADAILFTCSAFGPCIEAVAARLAPLPVLKPNEAMIDELAARFPGGARIGLIATFEPTLRSMPPEFPAALNVAPLLAAGALEALNQGRAAEHDARVTDAARVLHRQGVDALALAQFSMARAAPAASSAVPVPVFTTVGSAIRLLRKRLRG
jgi:aspartate/glutamate racemase